MIMKRLFLWLLVFSFVICSVPFLAHQARCETIQLKMAHFMSPMHIQHRKSFVPFSKKVEELTGGRVKIKIYPGGALGGPKQLPDAVISGITDIAFIIPSYTTGRFPHMSVMDLPFMVHSALHATQVIYDLYDDYLAEDFKDYKVLWFYSCGTGQLHSVNKPIYEISDLHGMKMRAPSAYMSKALKLLGANPVGMPISKLTISLEKGVIDGMLTPYSAVKDFRLFDLVKYITEVKMYVSSMAVVMNKQKFASLPDFAKKAIDQAAGKQWGLHAARVYDQEDQEVAQEIKRRGKITIIKLSDAKRQEFMQKLKVMQSDWVSEMSGKGLPAKKILNAALKSARENE
ncbi:MAG: hypothetical protein DRH11_11530 [Deltaproteobacteria bacterium]|nr:MAG: hypothetical protein DRH11_11530 [Deltaproteobacteria bacterium]